MKENGSIVVYRSQNEANADWFLQEKLFPWLYQHLGILTLITLAIIFYALWIHPHLTKKK